MQRNELWQYYVSKNPSFEGEGTVTMSKSGLKKLFETTYDQGFDYGKVVAQVVADKKKKTEMPSGFEQLFSNFNKK